MQHTVDIDNWSDRLGPALDEMVNAIEACVHCGFCLPTCPTYLVLGEEMDSPRGRIVLMKSVLEENLGIMEVSKYINQCLDCRACVTACPSGVRYDQLVNPFKAYLESSESRPILEQTERKFIRSVLPFPYRFHKLIRLGRVVKPFRFLTPSKIKSMLDLLPDQPASKVEFPETIPAQGVKRARVALHLGCVQQVLAQNINQATINVLSKNGVEVVIPRKQTCCGALDLHSGDLNKARNFALVNINVFPDDVDAIISNAAGCGSALKEYPHLFQTLPGEGNAISFSQKVKDVSEFLNEIGMIERLGFAEGIKVAYQDACHLAHGQKITSPPRRILSWIENLTLLEIPEKEVCCGSAGTYNLEHPHIADELGSRKIHNIFSTGAQAVVTGNVGCLFQLKSKLKQKGNEIPVYHIVELLELAYSTSRIG